MSAASSDYGPFIEQPVGAERECHGLAVAGPRRGRLFNAERIYRPTTII